MMQPTPPGPERPKRRPPPSAEHAVPGQDRDRVCRPLKWQWPLDAPVGLVVEMPT